MRRYKENMAKSIKKEFENFRRSLKLYGEKTFYNLSSAFLIWLFGILVFIPLAGSINRETEILCNLVFFVAFSLLIAWSLPGLKKIVDSFSTLMAKKYGLKRGLNSKDLKVIFRRISYIILVIVFYLLYSPFLMKFHSSINGIALILALIWIFLLAASIFPILFVEILKWLSS